MGYYFLDFRLSINAFHKPSTDANNGNNSHLVDSENSDSSMNDNHILKTKSEMNAR